MVYADSFDTDERKFYQDQKAVLCKMALSDQADEDFQLQTKRLKIQATPAQMMTTFLPLQWSFNHDNPEISQCKMRLGKV